MRTIDLVFVRDEGRHMNQRQDNTQSETATRKNAEFFLEEYDDYRGKVENLDTYRLISDALNREMHSMERVLDVGNGGVFAYETSGIGDVVGLDLFLDDLPESIQLPGNVTMFQGSGLDIPAELVDFDGVVVVMLIHHLVGKTVAESISNVKQLFCEVYRVLKPGARFIIVESCIPPWFYLFERLVFSPASFIIDRTIKHPPTLQYPVQILEHMLQDAGFNNVVSRVIPMGKHVIQYGFKVPSWVTPVQPVLFTSEKPG